MKTEIYVAGHKASEPIPSNGVFVPIQVGSGARFCPLSDNTGDNIAEKNDSFCELTALYWIWKNTAGQDYVGLFHYRRHMNFSAIKRETDKWGNIRYEKQDSRYLKENALNDAAAAASIAGYDIILPEKFPVYRAKCGKTVAAHYANSAHHFIADYETALAAVKEKYPDYAPYCGAVSKAGSAHFRNMFIMRRPLFDKYCAWLFTVLFAAEQRISLAGRAAPERRVFGYLSERLFNIFLAKLYADNAALKAKTLQTSLLTGGRSRSFKRNLTAKISHIYSGLLFRPHILS